MPRYPTLLHRFRRMLAPPGQPGEALGVPASGDDVEAELRPLLADLEDVDAEAARIAEHAEDDARRIREEAEREAAAILAAARERAEAERAAAAAEQRAHAQRRAERAHAEAAHEIERLRALREGAVAGLVAEVVECVRRAGR